MAVKKYHPCAKTGLILSKPSPDIVEGAIDMKVSAILPKGTSSHPGL